VIILTLTPRSGALLIVSALSWRGGSKRGRRATNSHGPPGLSLVPSGTTYMEKKNFGAKKKIYTIIHLSDYEFIEGNKPV
jgi:hypothetical protein